MITRRLLLTIGVVAVCGVSDFVAAQAPAGRGATPSTQQPTASGAPAGRGAALPATGTAVIRGQITTTDGKPLRRARVSLTSVVAGAQAPPAVSTNSQGMFEMRNVPAGSYRVSAARPSYLTVQFGQRRAQEAGRPITAANGATIDRIDISLPPGSVLAGTITDELGEGYPGVRVESFQQRYVRGQPVMFPAGTATTDDLGRYRIPGLTPGVFYLMASSKELVRTSRDKDNYAYGFWYYPGTTPDKAEPISLTAGQVRDDIDFRLTPTRTAKISGRAQSPEGAPLSGRTISVTFEYRGAGAVANPPIGTTRTAADGSFVLADVPPGTYRVLGAGSASIDVNGTDVTDVLLVPYVGSNITGSVVTDEGVPPPFAAAGLRVALDQGSGDVLSSFRVFTVNTDWSFALNEIGGPFRFRLTGLRDDWMVKSVTLDKKDITDVDFNVPTGAKKFEGMEIVISRKIARVSGSVTDKSGTATSEATVVLFPDDSRRWSPVSRQIRSTRPDENGTFTIGALPPGIYRLAARDYIADGQWLNAEFLESLRETAERVEVSEGGTGSINLRLP